MELCHIRSVRLLFIFLFFRFQTIPVTAQVVRGSLRHSRIKLLSGLGMKSEPAEPGTDGVTWQDQPGRMLPDQVKSKVEPFPKPYSIKDERRCTGYSIIGCVMDKLPNKLRRWYHNRSWTEEEDEEPMSPEVCYKFCRYVEGVQFFGLVMGTKCYCMPYFEQGEGSKGHCDEPCEGDPESMCGGAPDSDYPKSNIYSLHDCNNTPPALCTHAPPQIQKSVTKISPVYGMKPTSCLNLIRHVADSDVRRTCDIECLSGYTLEYNDLVCEEKGDRLVYTWGQFQGSARCGPISCGRPPNISNARVPQQNMFYDSPSFYYTCYPGYTANGHPDGNKRCEARCQKDGSFTDTSDCRCQPVSCSREPWYPNETNAHIVVPTEFSNPLQYGPQGFILYRCNRGYTSSPLGTYQADEAFKRKCMPDGNLGPPEKTCHPVKCGPRNEFFTATRRPIDGDPDDDPSQDFVPPIKDFYYPTFLEYDCNDGYSMDGEPVSGGLQNAPNKYFTLDCQYDGTWLKDPVQPCIGIRCGVPAQVQNAHPMRSTPMRYDAMGDTDEETVICFDGYTTDGLPSTHADDSTPDNSRFIIKCGIDGNFFYREGYVGIPTCDPVVCGAPPVLPNAQLMLAEGQPYACGQREACDFTDGEHSRPWYVCNPGYGTDVDDDPFEDPPGFFNRCKADGQFDNLPTDNPPMCKNIDNCRYPFEKHCSLKGQCVDKNPPTGQGGQYDYYCNCTEGYIVVPPEDRNPPQERDQYYDEQCTIINNCPLPSSFAHGCKSLSDKSPVTDAGRCINDVSRYDCECKGGWTTTVLRDHPANQTCVPIICGPLSDCAHADKTLDPWQYGDEIRVKTLYELLVDDMAISRPAATYTCHTGFTLDGTANGDRTFEVSCALVEGQVALTQLMTCRQVTCGQAYTTPNSYMSRNKMTDMYYHPIESLRTIDYRCDEGYTIGQLPVEPVAPYFPAVRLVSYGQYCCPSSGCRAQNPDDGEDAINSWTWLVGESSNQPSTPEACGTLVRASRDPDDPTKDHTGAQYFMWSEDASKACFVLDGSSNTMCERRSDSTKFGIYSFLPQVTLLQEELTTKHQRRTKLDRRTWQCNTTIHALVNDICYSPPRKTSDIVTTGSCATGDCQDIWDTCEVEGGHVTTKAELAKVLEGLTGFPDKYTKKFITSTRNVGGYRWLAGTDAWHFDGCCGADDRYFVCVYTAPTVDVERTLTRRLVHCDFTAEDQIDTVYVDGQDATASVMGGALDVASLKKTLIFSSDASTLAFYAKTTTGGCSTGGFALKCTSSSAPWNIDTSNKTGWKVYSLKGDPSTPRACLERDLKYEPPSLGSTMEGEVACQARCDSVSGCAHFTVVEGLCDLSDGNAHSRPVPGAVSGPPNCPATIPDILDRPPQVSEVYWYQPRYVPGDDFKDPKDDGADTAAATTVNVSKQFCGGGTDPEDNHLFFIYHNPSVPVRPEQPPLQHAPRNFSVECKEDGLKVFQPRSNPTCSRVSCGIPTTWSHASVSSIAELFFSDQVVYTCDDGYSIDRTADVDKKSFTVLCMTDAFLSAMHECKAVSCGTTPEFFAASNNRSGETVVFASSPIGYTCIPGYSLDRRADGAKEFTVTCTESGHFQDVTHLECRKIECGLPPEVNNSQVTRNMKYFEDIALYNCSWGYSLDQNPVVVFNQSNSIFNITCQANGQFTPVQVCRPVQCKNFPTPHMADLQTTRDVFYGDDAEFLCKPGWSQDGKLGARTLFGVACLPDGTFETPEDCKNMDDCVQHKCNLTQPACADCTCTNLPNPVGGPGIVPPLSDYKCNCVSGFEEVIITSVNQVSDGTSNNQNAWTIVSEIERVTCKIQCDRVLKVYIDGSDNDNIQIGDDLEITVTFDSSATRLGIKNLAKDNGCTDSGCAVHCDSQDPRWRINTNSLEGWEIWQDVEGVSPVDNTDGTKWYQKSYEPDASFDVPGHAVKELVWSGTTYKAVCPPDSGKKNWALLFMVKNGVERHSCGNINDCGVGFCNPPLCHTDTCVCNDLINDYICHCAVGFYPGDDITRADGVTYDHDCVPQTCPVPPAWGNATTNITTAPTYKDIIIYTCNDGYTLDAQAHGAKTFNVECKGRNSNVTTGYYNQAEFKECKPVECSIPARDDYTEGTFEDVVAFPHEITYTCSPGYSTDHTCDAASKTYTKKCNASGVYEYVGGVALRCKRVLGLNPTATETPGIPVLTNAVFPDYLTCVTHCPAGQVWEPNGRQCIIGELGSPCGCTHYLNMEFGCEPCPSGTAVQDTAHVGGIVACKPIVNSSSQMFYEDTRQAACITGYSTDGVDDQLNTFTITANEHCAFENNIGCQKMSCGPAPAVNNASAPDPATALEFEETAAYTAHTGFSLGGEPDDATQWTAKCLADGSIEDLNKSLLQKIKCYSNFTAGVRSPPQVPHATRPAAVKVYLQTVLYTCDLGYATDSTAINLGGTGTFTITCQADGTFSATSDCLPINCGDPAAAAPFTQVYLKYADSHCCDPDNGCGSFETDKEQLANALTAEACGELATTAHATATFFMWNRANDHCAVLTAKHDECNERAADSVYSVYTLTAPLSFAQISINRSTKRNNRCTLPETNIGFDFTGCDAATNAKTESECVVRCAQGWGGFPTVACNTDGGEFVFNGCRVVPFPPMFADRINGTGDVLYPNRARFQCKAGWTITGQLNGGNQLSSRCTHTSMFDLPTHTCLDIDDCAGNSCTPNGDCVQVPPHTLDPYTHFEGYNCDCHEGYHQVVVNKSGTLVKTCNNTNDCPDDACLPGRCEDQVGGYICDCPIGYYMYHNSAITQMKSGVAIPAPGGEDCAPQECGVPPSVAHGEFHNPTVRYTYQEVATGECDEGYSTTGAPDGDKDFDLECRAGVRLEIPGSWEEPRPVCHPVQCSPAPDEDHASHDTTTYPPGVPVVYPQRIEYTCDTGYSVDGACQSVVRYFIRCNALGELEHEGGVSRCEPVKAEVSLNDPNDLELWKLAQPTMVRWAEFVYQQMKVFTCRVGYVADPAGDVNMPNILHISATHECTLQRESFYRITPASGEKPDACPQGRALTLEQCKALEGHAVHNSVSHVWGGSEDVADESCGCYINDGDSLLKFNSHAGTCDPDADEIPICKVPDADKCFKISCGAPPPVDFGTVPSAEKRYKETATYTAVTGYTLTGLPSGGTQFTVECEATGLFSRREVFKRITCGDPPAVDYAAYVGTKVKVAKAGEVKYIIAGSQCTMPYQKIVDETECLNTARTALGESQENVRYVSNIYERVESLGQSAVGRCQCPDGTTYLVGGHGDDCAGGCEHGTVLDCISGDPRRDVGDFMKVTCVQDGNLGCFKQPSSPICALKPFNSTRDLLYEDVGHYKCIPGYTTDQLPKDWTPRNDVITETCRVDGSTLTGPSTSSVCQPIKCPGPTMPYGNHTGTPSTWYYYDGDSLSLTCKPGYSTTGEIGGPTAVTARCLATGHLEEITKCINNNDCYSDQCEPNGDCVDKPDPTGVHLDDYTCDCDENYRLQRVNGVPTCEPDNHCIVSGGTQACIPGVCVNLVDTFECDCPESHYRLADDRKSCILKRCDVHDITNSDHYIVRGIEYRTYYPDKSNPPAQAVAGDQIRYTCHRGYSTSGAADGRKRFQILCHGNGSAQAQLVDRGLAAPIDTNANLCYMEGDYLTAHSGGSCMLSKPSGRYWSIDYTQHRYTMYSFKVRMTKGNNTDAERSPMGAFKPCNLDARGILRGDSPELSYNAVDGYKLKYFTGPNGESINEEYPAPPGDPLSPADQAEKLWVIVMEWKTDPENTNVRKLFLHSWTIAGQRLTLYDGMKAGCPDSEQQYSYAFTPRIWAYDANTHFGIRDFEVYQGEDGSTWTQQMALIQKDSKRHRRVNNTKQRKTTNPYAWWVDVNAKGPTQTECFRASDGGNVVASSVANDMDACKLEYLSNVNCKFITHDSSANDCFCLSSCSDKRESIGWSSARRESMEDLHIHGSRITNYQCAAGYEPLQSQTECQEFLTAYDAGTEPLGQFVGDVDASGTAHVDQPGGCIMKGVREGSDLSFKSVRFNIGMCQCGGPDHLPLSSCTSYLFDGTTNLGIYAAPLDHVPCLRLDQAEAFDADYLLCKPMDSTPTVCAQLAGTWDVIDANANEFTVNMIQTSGVCEGRMSRWNQYQWVYEVDGNLVTNLDDGDSGMIETANGRAMKITWASGAVYTKPTECKPIVCLRALWPTLDHVATVSPATDIVYGEQARFTCMTGYSTLGSCDDDSQTSFTATCTEDGRIVFDDAAHHRCIGNYVGVPTETREKLENARYTTFEMRYPDTMNVYCLPGYETKTAPPPADVTCTFTMQQKIVKVYVDGVDKTSEVSGDILNMQQAKTITFSSLVHKLAIYGIDERGCGTGGLALKCESADAKWVISTNSHAGWKVYSKQGGLDATSLHADSHPPPDGGAKNWYETGYVAPDEFVEPRDSMMEVTPNPLSVVGADIICGGGINSEDNHLFFTFDISVEFGVWGAAVNEDCERGTYLGSGYLVDGCKLECQVDTTCTDITYDTTTNACNLHRSCFTPSATSNTALHRYQFNRSQLSEYNMESSPDWCHDGILSADGHICCDVGCGECDTATCADLPGGNAKCCRAGIEASNEVCQYFRSTACVVPGMGNIYERDPSLGERGVGRCQCPDGQIYLVADNRDNCQTIACEGGTQLDCVMDDAARDSGDFMRVTCATVGFQHTCHQVILSTTNPKSTEGNGISYSSDGSTWTDLELNCTSRTGDCNPLQICTDSFYIKSADVVQPWRFYVKADCDTVDMEENARVDNPETGTVAKLYQDGQFLFNNDLSSEGPRVLQIGRMTWAFDLSPYLLVPHGGCVEKFVLKTTTACDWDPNHPVCIPRICAPEPEVAHSSKVGSPIFGGEGLTYTCDTGYTLTAEPLGAAFFVVHCKTNGRFTDSYECKRIQCEEVPTVANAVFPVGEILFYLDEITYECEIGHSTDQTPQRLGNRKFTPHCRASGQIQVMQRCDPIQCQLPSQKPYSTWTDDQDPPANKYYLDVLGFVCKNGWSVDGLPTGLRTYNAICRESGNFVDAGDCKDINWCHNNTNCSYGTCQDRELIYTCDCWEGYELVADPLGHTCKEIDECVAWSGHELCTVHGNCTDAFNTYHCTCDPGYTVEVIPCRTDKLCEICKILECGVPPPHLIMHALTRTTEKLFFGMSATYFCDPGFSTDPNDMSANSVDLLCVATGFSSTPSRCHPGICPLPSVSFATENSGWGRVNGTASGTNIVYEQESGTVQHIFDRWIHMTGTEVIQGNSERTIMGFFKTTQTSDFNVYECGAANPVFAQRFAFGYRTEPGPHYTFDTHPESPITWIREPPNVDIRNEWTFFAHTWDPAIAMDGSTGRHSLYLNGVLYAVGSDDELITGSMGCGFGSLSDNSFSYSGQVKGLKVITRAWSAEEIEQYHEASMTNSLNLIPPETPVDVTCDFTASKTVDAVYVDGEDKTSEVTGDLADKSIVKQITFNSNTKRIAISSHHNMSNGCAGGGLTISCDSTFGGWKISSKLHRRAGWKAYGAGHSGDTLPDALLPPPRDGKQWHEPDYVPGANFYPPGDAGVDSSILTDGEATEAMCDGNENYKKNWYFFIYQNPVILEPVLPPAPHTVGYTTQYKCNRGYTVTGEKGGHTTITTLCTKHNAYDPNTVACFPRECGRLPTLQFATFAVSDGSHSENLTVNQTATYTCIPGYTVTGLCTGSSTFIVNCGEDGQFNGTKTCKPVKCMVPNYPNSTTDVDFRYFSESLEVRCAYGYKSAGADKFTVQCEASCTFSDHPNCSRISCGVPANRNMSTPTSTYPPENTDTGEVLYQGRALYTCNTGASKDGRIHGLTTFMTTCDQFGNLIPSDDCFDIDYCTPNPCKGGAGICSDCSTIGGCSNPNASDPEWPGSTFLQESSSFLTRRDSYTYGKNGNYQCVCNEGFEIKVGGNLTCVNDDCYENDNCGEGGVCIDISRNHPEAQENAYSCICDAGWKLNLHGDPFCDPVTCPVDNVPNTLPDRTHYDTTGNNIIEVKPRGGEPFDRPVRYLEKVKYTCEPGYETDNEQSEFIAICSSMGSLQDVQDCSRVRCDISQLTLADGQELVTTRDANNPWLAGDVARIKCNRGYRWDPVGLGPFPWSWNAYWPYRCPTGYRYIESAAECNQFAADFERWNMGGMHLEPPMTDIWVPGGCSIGFTNNIYWVRYVKGFVYCDQWANIAGNYQIYEDTYPNAFQTPIREGLPCYYYGHNWYFAQVCKPVPVEPALLQEHKSNVSALASTITINRGGATNEEPIPDLPTCNLDDVQITDGMVCPDPWPDEPHSPQYGSPMPNCERGVTCCQGEWGFSFAEINAENDCAALGHEFFLDEFDWDIVYCCAKFRTTTSTTTTTTLQAFTPAMFCDDSGARTADANWIGKKVWVDTPVPEVPFTLMMRINTAWEAGEQTLISWGAGDEKKDGIEFGLTLGGYLKYSEFTLNQETGVVDPHVVESTSEPRVRLNDGQWHNVVVSRDEQGTVTLYYDGVFAGQSTTFPENLPSNLNKVAAAANLRGDGEHFGSALPSDEQRVFVGRLSVMRWLDIALDPLPRIKNDWTDRCQIILATCQETKLWEVSGEFRCIKKICGPLRDDIDHVVPNEDHGVKQLEYQEDYVYYCEDGYTVDQDLGIRTFTVYCEYDQVVRGYRECNGIFCGGIYNPQYAADGRSGNVDVVCPPGTMTVNNDMEFSAHCGKYGRLTSDWACYPKRYSVRGHLYDAGSAVRKVAKSLTLEFNKLPVTEHWEGVDKTFIDVEGRWILGASGQSCTDACSDSAVGMTCYETSQTIHNGDVDTRYVLWRTMASAGTIACSEFTFAHAREKYAPGLLDGKCMVSAIDRLFNTFDCAHTKEGARRLCYCSAPFDNTLNADLDPVASDSNGFYRVSLYRGKYEVKVSCLSGCSGDFATSVYPLTINHDTGQIPENYSQPTNDFEPDLVSDFHVRRKLSASQMRLTLSWGASPEDLDAVLVYGDNVNCDPTQTPMCSSTCETSALSRSECDSHSLVKAVIQRDSTTQFGPESIFVNNVEKCVPSFQTNCAAVFLVRSHEDIPYCQSQSETLSCVNPEAAVFRGTVFEAAGVYHLDPSDHDKREVALYTINMATGELHAPGYYDPWTACPRNQWCVWVYPNEVALEGPPTHKSVVDKIEDADVSFTTHHAFRALQWANVVSSEYTFYVKTDADFSGVKFTINDNQYSLSDPPDANGYRHTGPIALNEGVYLIDLQVKRETTLPDLYWMRQGDNDHRHTKGDPLCALTDSLDQFILRWDGSGCASGQHIEGGATCTIVPRPGFVCVSPGLCSAGSFANTPSCEADPMPSTYVTWLSTDPYSIGLIDAGIVRRVSSITDKKADTSPIELHNAGVGTSEDDFISWNQANGFKLTNGNVIVLPMVAQRGEWTIYLSFKTSKSTQVIASSKALPLMGGSGDSCIGTTIGFGEGPDAPLNTQPGRFYVSGTTLDASGACVTGPSIRSDAEYNNHEWHWVEIYGSRTSYSLRFDDGAAKTEDLSSYTWSSDDAGGIMTSAPLKIGSEKNADDDPYYDGYIKDVMVFHRALTADEKIHMHKFYDAIKTGHDFLAARLETLPD